jgi:hypothetical protein
MHAIWLNSWEIAAKGCGGRAIKQCAGDCEANDYLWGRPPAGLYPRRMAWFIVSFGVIAFGIGRSAVRVGRSKALVRRDGRDLVICVLSASGLLANHRDDQAVAPLRWVNISPSRDIARLLP